MPALEVPDENWITAEDIASEQKISSQTVAECVKIKDELRSVHNLTMGDAHVWVWNKEPNNFPKDIGYLCHWLAEYYHCISVRCSRKAAEFKKYTQVLIEFRYLGVPEMLCREKCAVLNTFFGSLDHAVKARDVFMTVYQQMTALSKRRKGESALFYRLGLYRGMFGSLVFAGFQKEVETADKKKGKQDDPLQVQQCQKLVQQYAQEHNLPLELKMDTDSSYRSSKAYNVVCLML